MSLRIMLAACAMALVQVVSAAPTSNTAPLVTKAKDFMRAYGEDLKQGNRAALGARYHPGGSYVLGDGHKSFETHAATVALYNKQWRPPANFEWQDLSYEQVGAGSVAVFGRFKWVAASGAKAKIFSYSAILMVVDGDLRIRAEDESTTEK